MHRPVRRFLLALTLSLPLAGPAGASEGTSGKAPIKGVGEFEIPSWFKTSFLDLREDVEEAAAADRRLAVFFHQEGCPYCDKLVNYNFSQKEIRDYAQQHFDWISINMWGDREVTSLDGETTTEKQYAEQRKVWFTPTLLFFDSNGEVVLRVNGYYPPNEFMAAMQYVAERKEDEMSFGEYAREHGETAASEDMHDQPFLSDAPHDLSGADGPLVVYFEQPQCRPCDTLHQEVLADAKTRELIEPFRAVQLNRWSDTPVVTPSGEETTAREWADELGIEYLPTAVHFDEGEEIIRMEAMFKKFHAQTMLDFVASEAYREYDNFQRYVSARADELREKGVTVDLLE